MLIRSTTLAALLLTALGASALAAAHIPPLPGLVGISMNCEIKRTSQTGADVWLTNPASPIPAGTAIKVSDNTGHSAVFTTSAGLPPGIVKHNFPLIGVRCTARTTLLTVLAPPGH